MKERRSTRHDTQLIPNSLCKVTVSWALNSAVDAEVVNFCAHGMKVVFELLELPVTVPRKNDIIKIKLPIVQLWLTGKCVYVIGENGGPVSMGICYLVPLEQKDFKELLGKIFNNTLQPCSADCHERDGFLSAAAIMNAGHNLS